MIKAIDTEYHGCRFRSRLEARWAVFFDQLGIEWQYEAEGYQLSDGTRYLPDFWLPTFSGGMHVEVKPDGGDFSKARKFAEEAHVRMWLAGGIPAAVFYEAYGGYGDADCNGWEVVAPNYADAYGENRMWYNWGQGFIAGEPLDEYSASGIEIAASIARTARFEFGCAPKIPTIHLEDWVENRKHSMWQAPEF
jgi:hypothetical protein